MECISGEVASFVAQKSNLWDTANQRGVINRHDLHGIWINSKTLIGVHILWIFHLNIMLPSVSQNLFLYKKK